MTTYTIAILNDMLVATAVDGDTAMMAARLDDARNQGIEFNDDDLAIYDGLTLFEDSYDAEEAGATIVYRGCDMGWLQDADGNTGYMAAGRL